ncbi:MAG: hypothetical protein M3245_03955, partial [Actinomycetota bacterium]|nr:hypothetical protein [Actinomycetota bacterium]
DEGTLFLRIASTGGGGGLEPFGFPQRIPLSAQILYFEGAPPELTALDLVEVDPETRDLTIRRRLVTDLVPPDPDADATPSPEATLTPG